jgi:hypothetical protein
MGSKRILWIGVGIAVALVAVVVVTLALVPSETNPAFAAAEAFAQAAGRGDDAAARALLSDDMQAYVEANCPEGSVSACVDSFTPPEWGAMKSAVYRRAAPDGGAWDVDLISYYEADRGASGVCIYQRMEQNAAGEWRVAGWAGFVHCGDPASRNMASNPDAPNRAP